MVYETDRSVWYEVNGLELQMEQARFQKVFDAYHIAQTVSPSKLYKLQNYSDPLQFSLYIYLCYIFPRGWVVGVEGIYYRLGIPLGF